MPELPEVQTTVDGLARAVRGLRIVDVWTSYESRDRRFAGTIKDPAYFRSFRKSVVGARILRVDRIAKNILLRIERGDESVILIHMKMTGHIMVGRYRFDARAPVDPWFPAPGERPSLSDPYNRFIRFVLSLSDGRQLVLSDVRKFAKVALIPAGELDRTMHLAGIGPDPLAKGFYAAAFQARLSRRPNGRIKTVLMDQSVLAGIGNIYSDEALWRAGLHPEERVRDIPDARMKKLFATVRSVLSEGIDFGGDSMSDYRNVLGERGRFQGRHRAYRKTGERCSKPGCRGIITRKVVGGRSAHFCSEHQRLSVEHAVQEHARRH